MTTTAPFGPWTTYVAWLAMVVAGISALWLVAELSGDLQHRFQPLLSIWAPTRWYVHRNVLWRTRLHDVAGPLCPECCRPLMQLGLFGRSLPGDEAMIEPGASLLCEGCRRRYDVQGDRVYGISVCDMKIEVAHGEGRRIRSPRYGAT